MENSIGQKSTRFYCHFLIIRILTVIRPLNRSEYGDAVALSLKVFLECGSADFDENGLNTFKSFIYSEELMSQLAIFGAFENDVLIGIIGTKNDGEHISLYFIDPKFHRRGIGKKLFEAAYKSQQARQITVNSSSYARGFYESLGFSIVGEEQESNGLRYLPMKFEI